VADLELTAIRFSLADYEVAISHWSASRAGIYKRLLQSQASFASKVVALYAKKKNARTDEPVQIAHCGLGARMNPAIQNL